MSMSIYRSAIDEYADISFLDRIINCIGNKDSFSTFISLSTPVNMPRIALLNKCKDRSNAFQDKIRKIFWVKPFNAWEMLSIGNLSLALLWHIYKSLPETILSDEKIIYRLGKISVALPALSNLFKNSNNYPSMDSEQYALLFNKTIPPDKKSSVSSIFSVCDQINELSDSFVDLSKQISQTGNFDSMVIPICDIDLCFPTQAISLLFTIKNFMCCKHMCFIIVSDIDLLGSALNSSYNQSMSQEDCKRILYALFDDWIQVPSPAIKTTLKSLDNKIISREKEHIISLINKSGIIPLLPDPAIIHHSFNRFHIFLINLSERLSSDEYAVSALLFLIGCSHPDLLKKIALLPDLRQFIAKIRSNDKNNITRTHKKKNNHPTANQFTLSQLKKNEVSLNFPLSYYEIIYKDNKLLSTFFVSLPPSVSDTQIEKLIIKIIPFL